MTNLWYSKQLVTYNLTTSQVVFKFQHFTPSSLFHTSMLQFLNVEFQFFRQGRIITYYRYLLKINMALLSIDGVPIEHREKF